jgi:hypothetical protein
MVLGLSLIISTSGLSTSFEEEAASICLVLDLQQIQEQDDVYKAKGLFSGQRSWRIVKSQ